MSYCAIDFKTKKALKEAIKAGRKIRVFQPGGIWPDPKYPGKCFLEGPHYPKPHTWYAECWLDEEGFISKIK